MSRLRILQCLALLCLSLVVPASTLLAADTAPVITSAPKVIRQAPGTQAWIRVEIGGTAPLSHSWKKNGVAIADQTDNLYVTVPSAGITDRYTITTSNSVGSVTSAEIEVGGIPEYAPIITYNPEGMLRHVSENHIFRVYAYGENLKYQWYKNGVALPSATQSYLPFESVSKSDEGDYHAVVSNSAGQAVSLKAKLRVPEPTLPVFRTHPEHSSLLPGQPLWLGVYPSLESMPVTYQWNRNGVPIPGATSYSYSVDDVQPVHGGSYSCTITNSKGALTSESAVVTIDTNLTQPIIRAQSGSMSVASQDSAEMFVQAPDDASFVWKKDGVIIPDAIYSRLYIDSVRSADVGEYTVDVTAGEKKLTSRTIKLRLFDLGVKPTIVNQPLSVVSPRENSSIHLYVMAKGGMPLTYQWYRNGVSIEGATESSYRAEGDADKLGDYKVRVSNANGFVDSDVASVLKMPNAPAPIIVDQPDKLPFVKEYNIYIIASVYSFTPVTYSWSKNGGDFVLADPWNGSVDRRYLVTEPGKYRFMAKNAYGSVISSEIEVIDMAALVGPEITASPTSLALYAGETITLSGSAKGATTYSWQKDGVTIGGATGSTLMIPNANVSHAGVYVMLASNGRATTKSAGARVQVEAAVAPIITGQPSSQNAAYNGSVSFSVQASGFPAPSYQWYKNDVEFPGATSSSFAVSSLTTLDQGTVKVVVKNSAGSATSNNVSLTVAARRSSAPVFMSQPQDSTFRIGEKVVFSVVVSANPIPSLQWLKNGEALAGATGYILEIPSATESDAASYSVVASNIHGSNTSTEARLVWFNDTFVSSFSGSWPNGDAWALLVRANSTAVFLAILASKNQLIVKDDVVINTDGSFEIPTLAEQTLGGESLASLTYTGGVKGKIENGRVSGSLPGAGLTFSAEGVEKGVTQNLSGYYAATSVNSVLTTAYTVITPGGTAIVGVSAGGKVLGGTATVSADGKVTLSGAISASLQVIKQNAETKIEGSVALSSGAVSMAPLPKQDQAASQRLLNLSTRGWVGEGQKELTAGLYIQGTEHKTVLIRAVGPTLAAFDVQNTVAEPKLMLYEGQSVLTSNQGWGIAPSADQIPAISREAGAFPLQVGSKDSVILATLRPGLYTAAVSEPSRKGGVALIEVYEVIREQEVRATRPRLYNLSTRGYVGSGGAIMIVGLVVDGDKPKKILIRGIGPTLTDFGITDALADPVLSVYKGSSMIAENDDWEINNDAAALASSSTKAGAFSLKSKAKDSAIILFVNPGNYTAHLRGKSDGTGIGLIEVYELTD